MTGKKTAVLHLLLFALLACSFVLAKRKKIDLEALEKEWAEEDNEDDDWHEDTFEWNEKERQKRSQQTIQGLMNGGGAGGGDMGSMMNMMGNNGGQSMSFAQIRDGTCEKLGHANNRDVCLNELAGRWTSLLKTAGIEFNAYSLVPNTILFTAGGINHHTQELKEFVLSQPETEKWTINNIDSYPDKETEIKSKAAEKLKEEERAAKDVKTHSKRKKNRKKKKKKKKKSKKTEL